MYLSDHVVVFAFTVLYPLYVYLTYPKIKKDLINNVPSVRLREYNETLFWLWLWAVLAVIVWTYNDRPLADLNIGIHFSLWGQILIALFVITPALLFLLYKKLLNNTKQKQAYKEQYDKMQANEFLPKTRREFFRFLLLSITAGICEEIIYRGFLIWYLEVFSSTTIAVIASSIVFGLAHSYQGKSGIIRTSLVGLVFALSYVISGSLWLPVFLHIFGDVYAGITGYLAYSKDGEASE